MRRLALVMDDRLSTSLPLDQVWREAEQYQAKRSAPASVIDDVFRNSITDSQQGRFSFTHELLGRYLAAEALTLQNRQPAELVDELRTPRHHDLRELAVELANSVPEPASFLPAWPTRVSMSVPCGVRLASLRPRQPKWRLTGCFGR